MVRELSVHAHWISRSRWTGSPSKWHGRGMNKLIPFASLALALAACAAPSVEADDPKAQINDPAFRAFATSSPREKVATLHAHFERQAARPGLTEAQRTAILGLRAAVNEVGFGPRNEEWEAWAMRPATEVEALRAAFGNDLESIHNVLDTID